MRVSYMELYNEDFYDLLVNPGNKLELREDPEKGWFVEGLHEASVQVNIKRALLIDSVGQMHCMGTITRELPLTGNTPP